MCMTTLELIIESEQHVIEFVKTRCSFIRLHPSCEFGEGAIAVSIVSFTLHLNESSHAKKRPDLTPLESLEEKLG